MQKFGLLFLAVSTALLGLVIPVEGQALQDRETNAERFARGLPPLAPRDVMEKRNPPRPSKRAEMTVEKRNPPRPSKRSDESIEKRNPPRPSKRADMTVEKRNPPRPSKRSEMSVEKRNPPRPSKRADMTVEKRNPPRPSKRADKTVEKRTGPSKRPSKRFDNTVERRNPPAPSKRPSKRFDNTVEKRNPPRPSKRADMTVEKRNPPRPSKRADMSVEKRNPPRPSKRADMTVEKRNPPRPSKRADSTVEKRNPPRPSKRADSTVEKRNPPRPSKRAEPVVEKRATEAEVFHAQHWQLTSGRLEVRWASNASIVGYVANNANGGSFGLNTAMLPGEDDLYVEFFESNLMVMNPEFPPPYFVGGGDESSAVHDCSGKIRFGTVELGSSSAVWTLDPMSGALTATLVNQDGSEDMPSLVYDPARNVLSFTHDVNRNPTEHSVYIFLSD